jgi:hypothetical protein
MNKPKKSPEDRNPNCAASNIIHRDRVVDILKWESEGIPLSLLVFYEKFTYGEPKQKEKYRHLFSLAELLAFEQAIHSARIELESRLAEHEYFDISFIR